MSSSDEIAKLQALVQSGALTQEEFERQKQQLLSGGGAPGFQAPPGAGPGMGGGAPPMPPTHMVSAVLVTLFCCLPFGIVAVIKATKVSQLYATSGFAAAQAASDEAKKWVNITAGIGLLAVLINVGIAVVVPALS